MDMKVQSASPKELTQSKDNNYDLPELSDTKQVSSRSPSPPTTDDPPDSSMPQFSPYPPTDGPALISSPEDGISYTELNGLVSPVSTLEGTEKASSALHDLDENDKYRGLGDLDSDDLLKFAYQIATGMVNY